MCGQVCTGQTSTQRWLNIAIVNQIKCIDFRSYIYRLTSIDLENGDQLGGVLSLSDDSLMFGHRP